MLKSGIFLAAEADNEEQDRQRFPRVIRKFPELDNLTALADLIRASLVSFTKSGDLHDGLDWFYRIAAPSDLCVLAPGAVQ